LEVVTETRRRSDTRQKRIYFTANTDGVNDGSMSCLFARGFGPAAAGTGNDTTPLGHGIRQSREQSNDPQTIPADLPKRSLRGRNPGARKLAD
jgi:hypothetical protein